MEWSQRAWLNPPGLGLDALCPQTSRQQPSVAMTGRGSRAGEGPSLRLSAGAWRSPSWVQRHPLFLESSGLWEKKLT